MAQQTKNAIRRAFIQLLNERPLDKISIKDIAEKGAVNRNTFYYYYADIYALVEDILQLEIQDFQSKLRRYDSWQEAFRDATAFASQNKRAVYHLYNSGNQETLRRYYHKVTLAAMTSYIRDQAEGLPADDEDIRVLSEFYAAALSGLTALWLQNGMKYDTDAYIDHLGHLLDFGTELPGFRPSIKASTRHNGWMLFMSEAGCFFRCRHKRTFRLEHLRLFIPSSRRISPPFSRSAEGSSPFLPECPPASSAGCS